MKKTMLLIVPTLFLLSVIGCKLESVSRQQAYNACITIAQAAKKYERATGYPPVDVHELEEKGYIKLKKVVHREWKFTINIPYEVVAKSTVKMPAGPDIEVVYEIPEPI